MNPPASRRAYKASVSAPAAGGNDRELVARMSAGDESALAQLYDRWSRTVYTLVVHLVRDGDDAEDVVEEAFWQAWRQASRYESSRGELATWLLTIARSRSLDRLRARRRRREEPLTPVLLGDADVAAGESDPARRAELGERRERVAGALRDLPAEQRQVLELAYFAGLSQAEIADRTGQPLGTVKTRTRLAAQKLRERLSVLRSVVNSEDSGNA
jgi:RNA polymerase sigma-70 factor (ECF subfamily)